MFVIKALVQLPDGSYKELPVARRTDNGCEVVKQPTKKEAYEWGKWILPDRISVEEEK